MDSRLDGFNDFLDVCADRNEMYIVGIFVDVISEDLLTLFVYIVDVVNNNQFFLSVNAGMGLTKRFHFVSIIIDALFAYVVDE
jgi:hypothetical protein